jgi:hypothetical protein
MLKKYKIFTFKFRAKQYAKKLEKEYGCETYVERYNWILLGGGPISTRWEVGCIED